LPDGRSLLWESIGKKFTGLDYIEADKISRKNKEFIKELFPASDIYASLFTAKAQKLIGEVGPKTKGVQRMLERIGMRYLGHIDPFDGGPHYGANTSELTLVRRYRTATVAKENLEVEAEEFMVGQTRATPGNKFRAVRSAVRFDDHIALLPKAVKDLLKLKAGDKVSVVPFEGQ
jgi:arginine N-succinyltransferase